MEQTNRWDNACNTVIISIIVVVVIIIINSMLVNNIVWNDQCVTTILSNRILSLNIFKRSLYAQSIRMS